MDFQKGVDREQTLFGSHSAKGTEKEQRRIRTNLFHLQFSEGYEHFWLQRVDKADEEAVFIALSTMGL